MSGHTPGPWKVDYGHLRGVAGGIVTASGPFRTITRLNAISRPATPEGKANARLIASAPELLEALRAAEHALTQFTAFDLDCRHIMGNTNFAIVQNHREAIRAAILKATGEQS